jgi:hypothetical protein
MLCHCIPMIFNSGACKNCLLMGGVGRGQNSVCVFMQVVSW